MADVVGTAFVRIKALTSGLSKDIEKSVSKGAKDADVSGAGELIGEDLVKGAARKIESGLGDVVNDSTKNIDKKVDVDGGRRIGDRLMEGIKSGLEKAVDSTAFKAIKNKILKLVGLNEEDGKKSGRSFGRGFLGAIAKFGVLFAPALLGAGSLILQFVVALTAQIGLLVEAALGGGAALATLFGAVALGAIPLVLAFKANTRELTKFKKVAADTGKAFLEIGAATQETLLPGLTDALELSKDLIPAFRGFGREIGRVAGAFAKMTVNEVVGDQERLRNILQGSSRIFETLSDVAFNFITIFLDLFEAAIPIGEAFADALDRMSDRWQNIVGEAADSGRLSGVLQEWFVKATLVGSALSDVFAAIFNILQAGSDSAIPFFDNFATWAADFRAFTDSAAGQNKLKQIFDDALEVAHEFNGLIVDIGRRIGAGVFEPGGNEGIIGFIKVLREDVVPFLDTTFRQVSEDMGPALTDLAKAFGEFIKAFNESGGLESSIKLLGELFDVLTAILSIPGMDKFLAVLLSIAAVGKVLKITGIASILKGIGTVIEAVVVPAVTALATILTGFGLSFGAALAVAIGIVLAVVAAIVLLVIHFDKVKAALAAVVRFFKDPMSRLTALKENIEDLVGVLREKLGQALGAAGQALGKFGSFLGEKLGEAASAAGEALSQLPGIIGRALGSLAGIAGRALGRLAGAVGRTLASLGSTILNAIGRGLRNLPGFLVDIFVGAIRGALSALLLVVVGIPVSIVRVLQAIGPPIGRALADAFGAAIRFVTQTLPTIIGGVLDFFIGLPTQIFNALLSLGTILFNAFTGAWDAVLSFFTTTAGPALLTFFQELPGNILNAITGLASILATGFQSAMDGVVGIVTTAIDAVIGFFTDLPGNLLDLVSDILDAATAIGGAIIDGIAAGFSATADFIGDFVDTIEGAITDVLSGLIDVLNDAIPDKINVPIGPDINLPNDPIPNPFKAARGGIFSRATQVLLGEAGREVVIPLTNPKRALELFNQSGLSKVLAAAQRGRNSSNDLRATVSQAPTGGVTPGTAPRAGGNVIIQAMNIEAPTPLETSRQVSDRLRILQAQLVSR